MKTPTRFEPVPVSTKVSEMADGSPSVDPFPKPAGSEAALACDETIAAAMTGAGVGEDAETELPMGRGRFLAKVASLVGLGTVAMPSLVRAGLEAVAEGRADSQEEGFLRDGPEFEEDEAENIIVRMQRELQKAMRKPIEKRK